LKGQSWFGRPVDVLVATPLLGVAYGECVVGEIGRCAPFTFALLVLRIRKKPERFSIGGNVRGCSSVWENARIAL
jgi:hypothetical protein